MKNLLTIAMLTLFFISCEKDEFNIDKPDVEKFISQIKKGIYDEYELGENKEKLWTIMPNFKSKHIPLLLNFSGDTLLVCPSDHFPTNPVSSIPPYRIKDSKTCIMIAEYLLWCVEGIILDNTYASLTPILVDTNKIEGERLNGKEILEVRKLYNDWWEEYGTTGETNKLPLEGTVFHWR